MSWANTPAPRIPGGVSRALLAGGAGRPYRHFGRDEPRLVPKQVQDLPQVHARKVAAVRVHSAGHLDGRERALPGAPAGAVSPAARA